MRTDAGLWRAMRLRPPLSKDTSMSFSLPDLPYAHDALQPFMSKETLEFHHDKHHLAYVNNGNNLLKGSELEGKSLEEIVKSSFGKNAGLFNNAGQHFNHMHFWKWMKPNGGGAIPGKLEKKIIEDFGSVEKMKEDFIQAGVTQFGLALARRAERQDHHHEDAQWRKPDRAWRDADPGQ
jgi:superoxide dismutase